MDYLGSIKGNFYIPSHCEATQDISTLIDLNRNKVNEIIDKIYEACSKEKTFEDILKYILMGII